MRHKLLSVDQQYNPQNSSKNICVNNNIVAMNSSSSISSTLQKLWLSKQFFNIFYLISNVGWKKSGEWKNYIQFQ